MGKADSQNSEGSKWLWDQCLKYAGRTGSGRWALQQTNTLMCLLQGVTGWVTALLDLQWWTRLGQQYPLLFVHAVSRSGLHAFLAAFLGQRLAIKPSQVERAKQRSNVKIKTTAKVCAQICVSPSQCQPTTSQAPASSQLGWRLRLQRPELSSRMGGNPCSLRYSLCFCKVCNTNTNIPHTLD